MSRQTIVNRLLLVLKQNDSAIACWTSRTHSQLMSLNADALGAEGTDEDRVCRHNHLTLAYERRRDSIPLKGDHQIRRLIDMLGANIIGTG